MLRRLQSFTDFSIGATDGEIGKVSYILFDDQSYITRYLVIKTGGWLSERNILLPPSAIKSIDEENKIFYVALTKEEVKNSPDIDMAQPVSRQQETALYAHYGWDAYWGGTLWGGGLGTTGMLLAGTEPFADAIHHEELANNEQPKGDPHLRSSDEVEGYAIKARDGELGDIVDFIVNDNNWTIEWVVVETGNWFEGNKILLSPKWIKHIAWDSSTLEVSFTQEQLKNSPKYDDDAPVTDDYIADIYRYYERQ